MFSLDMAACITFPADMVSNNANSGPIAVKWMAELIGDVGEAAAGGNQHGGEDQPEGSRVEAGERQV